MSLNIVRSSLVDAYSYSRSKDFEGSGGSALGKAMSTDPWYKEIVPNVGNSLCASSDIGTTHAVSSSENYPRDNFQQALMTGALSNPSVSTQPCIYPGLHRNASKRALS